MNNDRKFQFICAPNCSAAHHPELMELIADAPEDQLFVDSDGLITIPDSSELDVLRYKHCLSPVQPSKRREYNDR